MSSPVHFARARKEMMRRLITVRARRCTRAEGLVLVAWHGPLALVEEGFDAAYEFPQHAEVLEILIGFFLAGLEEIDVGQSCVFFSSCLEHLTPLLNYSYCPLLILHGVNLWNSQIVEVSAGLLILLWKTLTGDS